ncbi:MAG: hypothetical protein SVN78_03505 [Deferribacterota bacterium]|nr:hypothetical protein [Deferribacterota bacterium]
MAEKKEYLDYFRKYVKGFKMEDINVDNIKKLGDMAMDLELSPIIAMPYSGNIDEIVTYETDEITAQCPVTTIQDYYKLKLTFIPDKVVPELKSLKFYFLSFKDIPISHENLFAKIYKDFVNVIKPLEVDLKLDCSIRGGIRTTITYKKDFRKNDF